MNPATSSSRAMIELIKVSKVYPPNVHALADISFAIRRGEFVFLTGVSGAGKTTLLRLISRLERPSKGMVEVAGMDLEKLPQRHIHLLRRKIGIACQDFNLLDERTVAANIALAMEVVYRSPAFIEKRTCELLEQLDLLTKYDARAGDLSRGEQQRVSIARAVANSPEIVLVDEPTGSLDAETTGRVMDLFQQLHRQGTTLLVATHDRSLLENSPHRVIELRFGQICSQHEAQQGPPHLDHQNDANQSPVIEKQAASDDQEVRL
jgi:cell division transport system ATP-binding protein